MCRSLFVRLRFKLVYLELQEASRLRTNKNVYKFVSFILLVVHWHYSSPIFLRISSQESVIIKQLILINIINVKNYQSIN